VNELESGIIPLLEKEGWMRDQENIAKQPCSRRRGGQFAELTTPSAAFRRLRDFLLMPQPPLLFKEGNVLGRTLDMRCKRRRAL